MPNLLKEIEDKELCCGCTACLSVCPHNAIIMYPDACGFLYPVIETEKCVECGLCEQVCDFRRRRCKSDSDRKPLAYGVRHKNLGEVATSRSGGMFTALSDDIIARGGVVYGAVYAKDFRIVHKRVTTMEDCRDFKGSKYVQSDLGDIFHQVKADLKKGTEVLFSGTPCQTAGLRAFLGSAFIDQLLMCDIVCHGVPSPGVWADYLSWLEEKFKSKVVHVNLRDKSKKGWAAHWETIAFKNGKVKLFRLWTDLFYAHVMFRPSCGVCKYAHTDRPSDITLADFWGWEDAISPLFNADDKGCSLVLLNSEKGKQVFTRVRHQLNVLEAPLEKCLQPNLRQPTVFSDRTLAFWKDYQTQGIDEILRKYSSWNLKGRIKMSSIYSYLRVLRRFVGV